MKKILLIITFFLFSFCIYHHPGRIDSEGGHYNHSTGEYHYHHGYPAHQHTNGKCPYEFDDNTNHSSNESKNNNITKITKEKTTDDIENTRNITEKHTGNLANSTQAIFFSKDKLQNVIITLICVILFAFLLYSIKSKRLHLLVFFIATLLVICIGFMLHFRSVWNIALSENKRLQNQIEVLSKEIQTLEVSVSNLKGWLTYSEDILEKYKEQSDFIDKYVVFIEDDNTNWYHKYYCNKFIGDCFWVFNIDTAIEQSYEPCPYCH